MKGQQKRMSPHIYFLAILFLYNYTFVLNVTFFFIDIVKVNGLRLSRLGRRPCIGFPVHQGIDQRGFAHI